MPARKWVLPLLLVSVLVFVLSLRQLSDPDLGFHLKYGRWIVSHHKVPQTDHSTYTVHDHPYIDLHWLFQTALYGVFILGGYPGISVATCLLTLLLFGLLYWRLHSSGISLPIICFALLSAFLIIEQRIAPRPELFTFLFLAGTVWILDLFYEGRKNRLYLLPLIMLVWCNLHSLYILGLCIIAIYLCSWILKNRKADVNLLVWSGVSFLACLINPNGINALTFPVELLTRFDPNNIFNQHIQEFMPFFSQPRFVFRDYLFVILIVTSIAIMWISRKRLKLHEIILMVIFGFLAIGSIRNIPLYVIIALPILSRNADTFQQKIIHGRAIIGWTLYVVVVITTFVIIPRLITNAYYLSNNSFNKTGIGINKHHLPSGAADFLVKNELKGRLLNSIGFGGWLSWRVEQPVFIDSRLEVMQESLYEEITASWKGGLAQLISKYNPQLIVYNYLKYYPWTFQLKEMPDWRIIFADGTSVIFARNDYASWLPAIETDQSFHEQINKDDRGLKSYFTGIYTPINYDAIDRMHLMILFSQLRISCKGGVETQRATAFFNEANRRAHRGEYAEALANYDSAIRLYPQYARAYNNRGILRASVMKDYKGALADFNAAIGIDHNYGDAYLGRGTIYYFLHDSSMACRDWTMAHVLGNVQATRLIELHCNR